MFHLLPYDTHLINKIGQMERLSERTRDVTDVGLHHTAFARLWGLIQVTILKPKPPSAFRCSNSQLLLVALIMTIKPETPNELCWFSRGRFFQMDPPLGSFPQTLLFDETQRLRTSVSERGTRKTLPSPHSRRVSFGCAGVLLFYMLKQVWAKEWK